MGTSSPRPSKQSTNTLLATATGIKTTSISKSKSRSSGQRLNQNRLYTKALHSQPLPTKVPPAATATAPATDSVDVNDSLAICLLGYNSIKNNNNKMYDSEYEEEVRKQAVMQEVLPDATMWKKWEATEAPLRQGRGWYPTLDRHFLELLVISEIHCLSHPLQSYNNPSPSPNAERIHRHASRVRRVACDRIGSERLHAYCDRVKEAFEAYVQGGWGNSASEYIKSEVSDDPDLDIDLDGPEAGAGAGLKGDGDSGGDTVVLGSGEERGRSLEREGSALKRRDSGPSPTPTNKSDSDGLTRRDENDTDVDVSMVIDVSPLQSPIPSLSHTDSDGEDADTETAWDEAERDLLKIDLEGVVEVPEDEADEDTEDSVTRFSDPAKGAGQNGRGDGMDLDIVLGGDDQIPKIHIITPAQT